jgi:hypothetical protein
MLCHVDDRCQLKDGTLKDGTWTGDPVGGEDKTRDAFVPMGLSNLDRT